MLKIEGNALRMLFSGQPLYIPKPKATVSEGFTYEGENNKYILMLYQLEGAKDLPLSQKGMLEKMLGAVRMGIKDVALLNIGATTPTFDQLKTYFAPVTIFLWGINPSIFGVRANKYSPLVHNGVKIIVADSFAELENNPAQKKVLWNLLQTLYL